MKQLRKFLDHPSQNRSRYILRYVLSHKTRFKAKKQDRYWIT